MQRASLSFVHSAGEVEPPAAEPPASESPASPELSPAPGPLAAAVGAAVVAATAEEATDTMVTSKFCAAKPFSTSDVRLATTDDSPEMRESTLAETAESATATSKSTVKVASRRRLSASRRPPRSSGTVRVISTALDSTPSPSAIPFVKPDTAAAGFAIMASRLSCDRTNSLVIATEAHVSDAVQLVQMVQLVKLVQLVQLVQVVQVVLLEVP